jgi:hypothetical protein
MAMTGDPLDETVELRKVLGLSWDTEKDEICINVKINYGEKKKRAYEEDSADLSRPEASLQDRITRRVPWCGW